jgi:hypothetical protein
MCVVYVQVSVSCGDCIHMFFGDDEVSSTLYICVPNELIELMKETPVGQVLKVKTSLEYSEACSSLILTAKAIDFVSDVRVTVK